MIRPALLKRNFSLGRGGRKPDVIVIHIMAGTLAGSDAWFRNPTSGVSAHYGVSLTGKVVQWVQDGDTAWHAGTVHKPTAALVKERLPTNPNKYSLGIECEGTGKEDPPATQMDALVGLVKQLATVHHIPLDRKHIIGHREIRSDKTCPGKIDVDEVVRRAAA
jgi:N-acetyl-anhydromuramyl-L-alanine amidase AmpD